MTNKEALQLATIFPSAQVPKSIHRIMIGCVIAATALAPASAPAQQSKPAQAPSEQQLKKQFRDGFMKGCLQGKTPGVKSQSAYCNCIANSYQRRYDGQTLASISQVAGQLGERGPALVNLMMAPETSSCAKRS